MANINHNKGSPQFYKINKLQLTIHNQLFRASKTINGVNMKKYLIPLKQGAKKGIPTNKKNIHQFISFNYFQFNSGGLNQVRRVIKYNRSGIAIKTRREIPPSCVPLAEVLGYEKEIRRPQQGTISHNKCLAILKSLLRGGSIIRHLYRL